MTVACRCGCGCDAVAGLKLHCGAARLQDRPAACSGPCTDELLARNGAGRKNMFDGSPETAGIMVEGCPDGMASPRVLAVLNGGVAQVMMTSALVSLRFQPGLAPVTFGLQYMSLPSQCLPFRTEIYLSPPFMRCHIRDRVESSA